MILIKIIRGLVGCLLVSLICGSCNAQYFTAIGGRLNNFPGISFKQFSHRHRGNAIEIIEKKRNSIILRWTHRILSPQFPLDFNLIKLFAPAKWCIMMHYGALKQRSAVPFVKIEFYPNQFKTK